MSRLHWGMMAIGVLVVLNLVRWWPDSVTAQGAVDKPSAKMLALHGIGVTSTADTRNIFFEVKKDNTADKSAQQKSADMVEIKKSNPTLSSVRLIGVVYRNRFYEAFLINGDEYHNVKVGQVIENRYKIKRISITQVELMDVFTEKRYTLTLEEQS